MCVCTCKDHKVILVPVETLGNINEIIVTILCFIIIIFILPFIHRINSHLIKMIANSSTIFLFSTFVKKSIEFSN